MNDNALASTLTIESAPASRPSSSMLSPIIWVGGTKGGVGKSMTSLLVLDQLIEGGHQVLFLETDTNNPDVYRCLQRDPKAAPELALPGVIMQTAKLSERVGWLELVDLIDAHRDRFVVVNTAANLGDAIREYGAVLHQSLPELGRRLVTLWLMNRQRDSMDQLREHIQLFPGTTVHAVRNGYFGSENQFELYNSSRLRTQIEETGGKSLTLPDLADRVADALYTQRMTISDGMAKMGIGNRAELRRWRDEAHQVFRQVLA
jgi:hypothetical protein